LSAYFTGREKPNYPKYSAYVFFVRAVPSEKDFAELFCSGIEMKARRKIPACQYLMASEVILHEAIQEK
jgi:hypothetical protein